MSEHRTPFRSPSVSSTFDFPDDLANLFELGVKYHNHPLMGFLNINILRYNIIDLRIIVEKFLPDILIIEETKLILNLITKPL